jgi:hypothetical protein
MLPRTRASFVGVRLAGAGWWVFESQSGRVVEPYRPALAEALARVRMGEVVLDEAAAQKIVDTIGGEEGELAIARDSNSKHPGEAVDSGLRFKLDYYGGWRNMYADTIAGAFAAAQRSISTGQWESLPDWDAKVMDQMRSNLDELVGLAEKTEALAAIAAPPSVPAPSPRSQPSPTGRPAPQPATRPSTTPSGTQPVAAQPVPGPGIIAQIEAWPAPAKIGAGIGAAAVLVGLGYALFG